MAVVNLPDSPANGTTQTVNGITYTYNSSKGYWTAAASSGGGGGGGASVTTDDSAPGSPSDGDLWYDTDDGGMFVYYQDTDSSQWVEVIGSQGAPGAAGAAGAAGATTAGMATVYATVDALPMTGNTQGDMAHVTATNTLYFWNGSGWYKIALINTNPSISGVASAYALAINGTATTVTVTATDPEGLPITYSIVSDTSGNIASVSQGTGANTNVFTITPSTNTAYAGSFTLTFRASDGVNIATAPATFTLQFKVQNSRYTSSLITSVGANNAVNNSFDDKSTSDHTITANGNVTQTTFSPYGSGGYSVYCDGNDAVKFNETSSDEFTFGTGDFTMEGWFWIDYTSIASGGEHTLIGNNGTDGEMWFSVIGSNWGGPKYNFQTGNGSWANTVSSSANTVTLQEWVHLAVVRNSGTVNIYENGVSVANGSNTINIPNSNSMLSFMGRPQTYGQYAKGYIHDVRITKGTAVYTSNFTAPDEPMSAVTNTKLLAFRKPYIVDESASPLSSTLDTGDPETRPFAPYDGQEYSASSHLGSLHSDGSGDYLEIDDGTWLTLGNGNFCFETWIYNTATSGGSQYIFGQGNSAGQANSISAEMYINSNRTLTGGIYVGSQKYATSTGTIPTNIWTHVALVRNGGNIQLYINGTKDGENTSAGTDSANDQSTHFSIGRGGEYNGLYFNGNIADFRFVKGSSVHTGNFTPPTAPLTAITNTELLVQSTDAGIIDKGQSARDLTLFGNTKSSTTQNKFLTSSMYFDGSGDYIKWTNNEAVDWGIGGEPFTLEWWQWWPSIVNERSVGPQTGGGSAGWNGTDGHQWTMFTYSSSASLFMQWWNGSGRTDYEFNHGGALTASTWQHFAVVYDGTNLSLYIDGSRITHRTSGNTFGTVTNRHGILGGNGSYGGQSEIYYSDVRITKGLARYSGTSLTVPTAALKG